MTLVRERGSIVAELLLSDNGEPGILAGRNANAQGLLLSVARPWSMIEWSNPRRRFEKPNLLMVACASAGRKRRLAFTARQGSPRLSAL
jgi:hypothetical protein